MIIGVPKEIKNHEYRVSMTPDAVYQTVLSGHKVIVQSGAGRGIFATDNAYRDKGAEIVDDPDTVFERAELVIKVKEPLKEEVACLRKDQVLFTYLHLAADKELTANLVKTGATCIAYETINDTAGNLPLLTPMSAVAGRLASQVASNCLTLPMNGNGKLIGGLPGVEPTKVVIVGGGVVGTNAARIALGMGAEVVVLERSPTVMTRLESEFSGQVITVFSNAASVQHHLPAADIVVGAALIRGAAAPKIITEEMVKMMPANSVIVDVAIDQGGCVQTSRPTTHDAPTFIKHGVVHYCVTNMPGIVPHTSTFALSNSTLPYLLQLAEKGWKRAALENDGIRNGIAIAQNNLVCKETAQAHNMPAIDVDEVLH